jgi:hypothetical protein
MPEKNVLAQKRNKKNHKAAQVAKYPILKSCYQLRKESSTAVA